MQTLTRDERIDRLQKELDDLRNEDGGGTASKLVAFVLDKSGSMQSKAEATISGFNEFLKGIPGEARFTLVQFDTTYRIDASGVQRSSMPELDSTLYSPSGCTALHDAVVRAGRETEETIAKLDNKPSHVLFVIMTDGQENSSVEHKLDDVKAFIKRHDDWEFVFLGVDIDAYAWGGAFGIAAHSTVSVDAAHTGSGMASTSRSAASYMAGPGGQSVGGFYTEEEKAKAGDTSVKDKIAKKDEDKDKEESKS